MDHIGPGPKADGDGWIDVFMVIFTCTLFVCIGLYLAGEI